MNHAIGLLAAIGLGLSAGALLTEAAILVPFWRSLDPAEFLRWYRRNASLLLRFFGPLEVLGGLLIGLAAASSFFGGHAGSAAQALSSLLVIAVLLSFPIYFRAANQSFSDGTLAAEQVSGALRRWSA